MATIALDIGGTKIASAIFFPDGSMMFNRKTAPERKEPVRRSGRSSPRSILAKLTYRSTQKPYTRRRNRCLHPRYRLLPNNRVWAPNIPGWDNYPLYEELRSVTPPGIEIYIDSDVPAICMERCGKVPPKNVTVPYSLPWEPVSVPASSSTGTCCTEPTTLSAPPAGWPCNLPTGKSMTHADVSNITLPAMVSGHGYAMPYAPTSHTKENCARNPSVAYRPMMCSVPIMKKTLLPSPYCTKLSRCGAWLPQIWSACSNPQKIIWGGGVFGPAGIFIDDIYKEACKWAQPLSIKQVEFVPSQLSGNAGLIGAAFLAIKNHLYE